MTLRVLDGLREEAQVAAWQATSEHPFLSLPDGWLTISLISIQFTIEMRPCSIYGGNENK